jgi:hypothetical protein
MGTEATPCQLPPALAHFPVGRHLEGLGVVAGVADEGDKPTL